MNTSLQFHRKLLIFGVPAFLIGILILLVKSSFFQNYSNQLTFWITLDLVITVPLIYFLLIRKTVIPKVTIGPILLIGVAIGTFVLPSENQDFLNWFKNWMLPLVEISIVSYVIFKVRNGIKHFKSNETASFDFFTLLQNTCAEILPKELVLPAVTEISVFYYGFIYWKKRKLEENEFSYHKQSGSVALLVALIFIIAIETVSFHILLNKWNETIAWIFTGLSIYSAFQIFGFLKSMTKRPIVIENKVLYLRYGIMAAVSIHLDDIDRIEISSKDISVDKQTKKLSFLGELESHNSILYLKKEHTIIGLYGIKRSCKNMVLYVDDVEKFKNSIEQYSHQ